MLPSLSYPASPQRPQPPFFDSAPVKLFLALLIDPASLPVLVQTLGNRSSEGQRCYSLGSLSKLSLTARRMIGSAAASSNCVDGTDTACTSGHSVLIWHGASDLMARINLDKPIAEHFVQTRTYRSLDLALQSRHTHACGTINPRSTPQTPRFRGRLPRPLIHRRC